MTGLSGLARYTDTILPIFCTGSAPVFSQICPRIRSRSAESPVRTLILTSSWWSSADSTSVMTFSVRPFWPIQIMMPRVCNSERRYFFWSLLIILFIQILSSLLVVFQCVFNGVDNATGRNCSTADLVKIAVFAADVPLFSWRHAE